MARIALLGMLVVLGVGVVARGAPPRPSGQVSVTPGLFPFVLPWDDAGGDVTDVSAWLERPAGGRGFVVARNGHLFAGGRRIHLFGTNLVGSANFPSTGQADRIAARLARFGINCVRFHHMDAPWVKNGILGADPRTFEESALRRLDYLVAALKERGIYVDLNLHVGRPYPAQPTWEGMPAHFKGIDIFHAPMVAWQRAYARDLLTHVNAFTGLRYADEPAVALVEINNEDGLLVNWESGRLDAMPTVYAADLERQWNAWLGAKYRDRASMQRAWSAVGATGPWRRPSASPLAPSVLPGRVAWFRKAEASRLTPPMRADWVRFLWDTEQAYWTGMRDYLKKDLGVRSLVAGTSSWFSPGPIQAKLDVVDGHAYWSHPRFPGRSWDAADWTVQNVAMAGAPDGGTLPYLAWTRVRGRPFTVTEYNHPAPNTHSSEAFLLLAAYGALQDWDGIFSFAWSSHPETLDSGRINGFFDVDQHPAQVATLPAAAALFVRGDVHAPTEATWLSQSADQARERIARTGGWCVAGGLGMGALEALQRPVGIDVHDDDVGVSVSASGDTGATRLSRPSTTVADPVVSVHGELAWASGSGMRVVLVDTPRSKAVIGATGPRVHQLHGVRVELRPNSQDWAAVTLTAMDGPGFSAPGRILVTATGRVENTAMGWKNPERSTVGRDWGTAPTLVEGIPAVITLPVSASRVQAWSLDERGARRSPLPVHSTGEGTVCEIGPACRTLWYEILIRQAAAPPPISWFRPWSPCARGLGGEALGEHGQDPTRHVDRGSPLARLVALSGHEMPQALTDRSRPVAVLGRLAGLRPAGGSKLSLEPEVISLAGRCRRLCRARCVTRRRRVAGPRRGGRRTRHDSRQGLSVAFAGGDGPALVQDGPSRGCGDDPPDGEGFSQEAAASDGILLVHGSLPGPGLANALPDLVGQLDVGATPRATHGLALQGQFEGILREHLAARGTCHAEGGIDASEWLGHA